MIARLAKIAIGALAIGTVACIDLSAPKDKPASISAVILPEGFIVRGDAMRDSLGNIAQPSVIAFDGNGMPVSGFTTEFFVTDTVPVFRLSSDGSLVAGNKTGIGHILGQVAGVQTATLEIFVTVEPTTLVKTATTGGDTLVLVGGLDSATSIATFEMSVAVRGGAGAPTDSAIGGAFVNFRLLPPPLPSSPPSSAAAYVADETNTPSNVDTTNASGTAVRRLVVNSKILADTAVLLGEKVATLTVEASMSYRGVPLVGSPQRFVVTVKSPLAK